MFRYRLIIIALLCSFVLKAQKNISLNSYVLQAPKGNVILLKNDVSNTEPFSPYSKYELFRNEKLIHSFEAPKSFAEFEKNAGKELAEALKSKFKNVKDNDILKKMLNPSANEIGLFVLSLQYLKAINVAFADEEGNLDSKYKLVAYKGIEKKVMYETTAAIPINKNTVPELVQIKSLDSTINVSWKVNQKAGALLFGEVYRKKVSDKEFIKLEADLLSINDNGTYQFTFQDNSVQPLQGYQYYLQTKDLVGNLSPVSDIAKVTTVDYYKIKTIARFDAQDTTNGIYLHWATLPNQTYYSGLQLLRSRHALQDFVIIDTLPINDTSYLDTKLLANTQYYYQLRTLLVNDNNYKYLPAATVQAAHENKTATGLMAPAFIKVTGGKNGVIISWKHAATLDMFAYYVYRGTNPTNMQMISEPVQDTVYTDTTKNLQPGMNYLYAVSTMNNTQRESQLSTTVTYVNNSPQIVPTPSGIMSFVQNNTIQLQWDDVRTKYENIAGYMLYYKKANTTDDLKPLVNEILTKPFYEVTNIEKNVAYQFAVTAVNIQAIQSLLSNKTTATLNAIALQAPGKVYLRNITKGVEITFNEVAQQNMTGYKIYKRIVGDLKYTLVATLNANTLLYIDDKTIAGKLYGYKVTCTGTYMESDKSSEATIVYQKK